ncbi:unnamed protein product [Rhizopus stolonifer]
MDSEDLKQRAFELGAMNDINPSQLGAQQFGKELNNLLDAVDKEKCGPSQPAGVTTTIKQQQQHILEEYAEYMTMTTRLLAMSIFYKWKNDMPVLDQKLHWMACGLSSIWDLTNTDLAMKFLDCTRDELEQVSRPLIDKQRRKQYQLPTLVDQMYDIIVSLIEKKYNSKKATSYIQQIKTCCLDTERLLAALANLIKIIDTDVFLLNPNNTTCVTEYDFVMQVWASILKSLIGIHGVLHMSSLVQGFAGRKRSYSDARVGFKVDLRLLFDSCQNKHDLLALKDAKAANHPNCVMTFTN